VIRLPERPGVHYLAPREGTENTKPEARSMSKGKKGKEGRKS